MELLYGRHAVIEALRAGRRHIHRIMLGEGVRRSGVTDILAAAQYRNCPVVDAPRAQFERMGAVNHQGVMAEAGRYPYVTLDDLIPAAGQSAGLYLILDHLQDVQNVGTLLRTAEAMAVDGVLLPERRAAEITPAVVNASSGAVEHLRIAMVGNLVQAMGRLKEVGVWIAGLDADPKAVPLGQARFDGLVGLVVGAEGPGISRLVRERCDWLVSIPMYGHIESLNAAVAGSIALVAARLARPAPSI